MSKRRKSKVYSNGFVNSDHSDVIATIRPKASSQVSSQTMGQEPETKGAEEIEDWTGQKFKRKS
ncbi:MAG TPA: hypothetical protein VK675_03285 [Candidatus Paceibacterota bacterium]|nr:hypothetical protein [Candidatus Paceibacterota bacterium]